MDDISHDFDKYYISEQNYNNTKDEVSSLLFTNGGAGIKNVEVIDESNSKIDYKKLDVDISETKNILNLILILALIYVCYICNDFLLFDL